VDAEERTTLDRLIEELEDQDLALRIWDLALDRAAVYRSHSMSAARVLGVIDILAVLTGDTNEMVARDLGVYRRLVDSGADLG
jgi:hypothetical protein